MAEGFSGCAISGCPGPGESPVEDVMCCALHADSGVVVIEHDERGRPHPRVDMGRLRYSASSRRGRMLRMILGGI